MKLPEGLATRGTPLSRLKLTRLSYTVRGVLHDWWESWSKITDVHENKPPRLTDREPVAYIYILCLVIITVPYALYCSLYIYFSTYGYNADPGFQYHI